MPENQKFDHEHLEIRLQLMEESIKLLKDGLTFLEIARSNSTTKEQAKFLINVFGEKAAWELSKLQLIIELIREMRGES